MTVPLFHGTRKIYKSQIFRDGLGTPPTSEGQISHYLSAAFDLLAKELSFDWRGQINGYPDSLLQVQDMYFLRQAAQNTAGTTMNFRYGAIYLTSDVSRARFYAEDPPESIRFGYKMHDVLESHGLSCSDHPFVHKFIKIRQDMESCGPLVLQINDYDLNKLYNERGTALGHPQAGEQSSFEYKGKIQPDSMEEV